MSPLHQNLLHSLHCEAHLHPQASFSFEAHDVCLDCWHLDDQSAVSACRVRPQTTECTDKASANRMAEQQHHSEDVERICQALAMPEHGKAYCKE